MSPKEFFGESHGAWVAAMEALREFARVDGAPWGVELASYFSERTEQADKAVRCKEA